jgi:pyruvate/2-oxoglutarate/acetoin dehydrogenase E1 component
MEPDPKAQLQYKSELTRATDYLAKNPKTIFLGQSVVYPGNSIFKTLENVPAEQKIEMPVFEETQLGMCIGLALAGYIPVSIYPRFNFLLLAMNQLVNHLDKLPIITQGKARPKVIIRTAIGSERPLFPGVQHSGDFTDAFKALKLQNVEMVRLDEPDQIFPAYRKALERADGKSTLLIEFGDYYNEK